MRPTFYLRILQGGLALSLFFVLFVFKDLLFPYITSKQLSFNILMELLAAVWLVFILRYPAYRPRLNYLIYGLVAYFVAVLLSAFNGVDFNLSFWGDAERMLGFFHLFHFLIFFFILITVFRTRREWHLLLTASIAAASLVSLIGLFGENPYSTIGNTAYVSGYLIFNLFFAAILFVRTPSAWRYAYLLPVIIMLFQFKNMRTSGAIIGLAVATLLVLVIIGFLHEKKRVRLWLLSISAAAVLVVIFIFSQQQAAWFQNSFLRNLTSQKATFQTRLLSWQGAWQDFERHPLLGTGFGNYGITFDRQFDPKFFNYDKVETYFDRAHNNLIDIASTTGILGLVTYLSIFVFALIYLFRQLKSNGFKVSWSFEGRRNLETVLLIGLMAAYFIQNLAVFDSFVTYIALMIMLGFIIWLPQEDKFALARPQAEPATSWLKGAREGWLLVILALVAWVFISNFSIRPWRMFNGVISGYAEILSGRTIDGLETFRTSLVGTPLDRDGRATLINLASANPIILTSFPKEQVPEMYEFILELAHKNLAYNPQDNVFLLQVAQLYDLGARVFYDDEVKRAEYAKKSLEYSERAIAASPGRIPVYFSKAQALIVQGKIPEAIAVVEYAASLNPDYPNSYCRLGQMYALEEDNQRSIEAIKKCLDGGAASHLGGTTGLMVTASFLVEQEAYDYAVIVVEELVKNYNQDPEVWLNLAKLYLVTGEENKAREAGRQAVILDASLATDVEYLFSESD